MMVITRVVPGVAVSVTLHLSHVFDFSLLTTRSVRSPDGNWAPGLDCEPTVLSWVPKGMNRLIHTHAAQSPSYTLEGFPDVGKYCGWLKEDERNWQFVLGRQYWDVLEFFHRT